MASLKYFKSMCDHKEMCILCMYYVVCIRTFKKNPQLLHKREYPAGIQATEASKLFLSTKRKIIEN